ncbi:CD40 ligand-like [Heptranchias perlo]|uniref:CD40 ligand-like n=1 Tax=Heptranchias perlo TaxID=212740 RepID=UPI003559A134
MSCPGNASVNQGAVLTVSALVDNMNESSNKSTQQVKNCEHQPSVSVRVLIYLIAFLLLAHMVTSALLYVYFSVKFDKYIAKDSEEQSHNIEGAKHDQQTGDHPSTTVESIHSPYRTAAHLIATNPEKSTGGNSFPSDKGSPIKHWMDQGFPAFTRNINYANGKLVITEPGLYYVYCQVSFRLTSKKTASTSNVPFVQYIYLQRTLTQSTLLMKASKTPVDKNQASSFNSVNEGGVFEFKKGDQLFVTVTDPSLLSYDKATYFGIFQL